MQDVAQSGRTVMFVSHNMQAVSSLCSKGILLEHGQLAFCGDVDGAIEKYVSSWALDSGGEACDLKRPGSGEVRFTSVKAAKDYYHSGETKEFAFQIVRQRPGADSLWLSAHIVNQQGIIVAQADSRLVGHWLEQGEEFEGCFRLLSPWLKPGAYRLDLLICATGGVVDRWEGATSLHISPLLPYPHHVSEDGMAFGLVFADFQWESAPLDRRMEREASLTVLS